MSPGKKTLLVLAGIVAILVTGVFSAFVILVQDEPTPDDSDLRLALPRLAEDQNAWIFYAKAFEKLTSPLISEDSEWPPAPGAAGSLPGKKNPEAGPEEPPPTASERWRQIERGTAWEQPLVDAVLARDTEAFAIWEKGVARPSCLLPGVKVPITDLPEAFSALSLANLLGVRARNHARRGNDEAAMEDGMRLIRFGHQMEDGKGVLVAYLIGSTVKQVGLAVMCDLVRESRLPPAQLRRFEAEIAPYQVDPRALADTLRAEYDYSRSVLDKITCGEMDPGPLLSLSRIEIRMGSWERFLYKPNRTRRLMAEAFREMISAAPKNGKDAPDLARFYEQASLEQGLSNGNYLGGRLYRLTVGNVHGVFSIKCITNVQLAATRVLLAMKAFKTEKGRLPTTLDELVPEYLDAVPLDDFDGKPLRYNLVKKIIYTVGKDLRDDGGTTKQEFLDAKMKERDIDPKTADTETLKSFEQECEGICQMPDPSFPIEF
ncbi:MAG: hypothetical protein NTY65_09560 [Planctomycetota bacterium]|nr:hypothetical protein [Planctomycetota bacterium]